MSIPDTAFTATDVVNIINAGSVSGVEAITIKGPIDLHITYINTKKVTPKETVFEELEDPTPPVMPVKEQDEPTLEESQLMFTDPVAYEDLVPVEG